MAFGKTDLQRLGIFKEQSYTTIDDPYTGPKSLTRDFKSKDVRPMYLAGGYMKTKAANADGYFAPFERIYSGEAGSNYITLRRQQERDSKAKRISGQNWIPSSGHKNRSGVGSYFGCFQEIYQAFDPYKTVYPKQSEKPNVITNPGKKGTGYGYPDVCLNPFPEWQPGNTALMAGRQIYQEATEFHNAKVGGRRPFVSSCRTLDAFDQNPWQQGDPLAPGEPPSYKFGIANFPKSMQIGPTFIPSHPAKKDGGMKDGCLNKYPEHSDDPYSVPSRFQPDDKTKFVGGNWIPPHSTALEVPQPSIVNKYTDLKINVKTRKTRQKAWDFC